MNTSTAQKKVSCIQPLVLASLLTSVPALAQTDPALRTELESLKSAVQQLQKKVESYERDAGKPGRPASTIANSATPEGLNAIGGNYATSEDLESLKGLLEEKLDRRIATKSRVNFSGSGTIGASRIQKQPSAFRVNRGNLTFSGFLREDPVDDGDVRYLLAFDYSGPGTPGGAASTNVSDAVLIWDLIRNKTKREPDATMTATLGQQLVPFGSDNTAREEKLPTINRAQYLASFGISRDIGLTLDGGLAYYNDPAGGTTLPRFSYLLGVYNGAGANKWDGNTGKHVLGKVSWIPVPQYFSPFQGLKLGASSYSGRNDAGVRQARQGIEFEWLKKPFLTTAEFVAGKDTASNGVATKSRGAVATLFYNPSTLADFQPLVRIDRFDPNTSRSGDRRTVYTVGFNYFFWQQEPIVRRTYEVAKTERVVKLQVNYNRVREERNQIPNDQLLAQLVFGF
ncbi:MAG: hypothetical protein WA191_06335 [Telluria sp.]|nr:porin [Telluria sp.]